MDNQIQNRNDNGNKNYLIIGGIIVLALVLVYAFSDRSDNDVNNVSPAAGEVYNQNTPPAQNPGE